MMSDAKENKPLENNSDSDVGGDDSATATKAGSIVAIDRGVVHQICSGQVVLSLGTAVKELLENSLDAGATVVDIRLKEMGSELVEVSDNGIGVEHRNFKGLTVKHATSKLREFTDLFAVETFGFRGEALSSLCALSTLTISTRHKSSPTGTLMTYDHHGNILTSTTQARPIGTTVTLANLFSTMPVRQKEFQRSLKREFAKLVSVLSAYGLVSSGVRIKATNSKARGAKTVVIHTQGSDNIRENLVNIFGSKQVASVRPFALAELTTEDLAKASIRLYGPMPTVKLEGFISSPVHGEGRGAPDRQFYFVNNRPCDPTKLVKMVNQVYHGFNRHQYPFVCLNIITERSTVDINITPDKRQVFLTNEKFLNELVKKSLEKMFEDAPSTMEANTFLSKPNTMSSDVEAANYKENQVSQSHPRDSKFNISNLKRSFSSSFSSPASRSPNSAKKQKTLQSFFKVDPSGDFESAGEDSFCIKNDMRQKIENSPEESGDVVEDKFVEDDEGQGDIINNIASPNVESNGLTHDRSLDTKKVVANVSAEKLSIVFDDFSCIRSEEGPAVKPGLKLIFDNFGDDQKKKGLKDSSTEENVVSCGGENFNVKFERFDGHYKTDDGQTSEPENNSEVDFVIESNEGADQASTFEKKEKKVTFSMKSLLSSLGDIEKSKSALKCLKFKAQIKPTDNKNAEAELQKQIQKSDFANMEVYGQFNLGFMITGLKNDLFIIDQHATDEKYNFETLQKSTIIKSQKMVVPQKLELTSVSESVLLDNLAVFEKNGFLFEVDNTAPATEKVSLTALPISKNWTFGKEDIDELIFMLSEGRGDSTEHLRPSRVRAMFASRACRSSVMVGTSLSMQDMMRLVRHMGEIEQPWNCPHGRPTIRHLVNTEMVR
eukprot:GFUD01022480.1.p1 GENE.GFUD01022480.1~~GFUD01022480.1.p1  ORF type:complete len:889 (+),score=246.43 GFUD01022480.1:99-2765(+)